jgi:hypothetical protein
MNTEQIKWKLIHAVSKYDEKQSKKKSYNRNALGIYIQRIEEIMLDLNKGADLRAAVVAGFTGRLADTCLRELNLSITTDEEQRGTGIYNSVKN